MSQPWRSTPVAALARLMAAAGVAALLGSVAKAEETVSPEGIWYTKDQESIIRVHTCADAEDNYCGTIVWLKEPKENDGSPKLDTLNKDPAKRARPIIGSDILLNMKADKGHWKGSAYNPEDGKVYDITFKVKTDKEANDEADLRGCVFGFLCRTETFTRAASVPGGDPTVPAVAEGKHKGKKDARSTAHR